MNEDQPIRPEEIGPQYIDMRKILAAKNVKVPGLVIRLLNRLLHVEELNEGIYRMRHLFGLDFVNEFLYNDLKVKVDVVHGERLPDEGWPIIAGNHPLGGPDGLALLGAVGRYRKDVLFPVNDFLMYLPGMRPLFVPIDKVHRNTRNVDALEKAFAGENALLYFPAGLCSRKIKGEIVDLEWKPTFIKKSVKYQRDVVPVFFDARNRRRFYSIANWRKRLGIKFNFEMALLPGEMFAQRGKTMTLIVGKPIPYSTFDDRHTAKEWAALVREHIYRLKANPDAEFEY